MSTPGVTVQIVSSEAGLHALEREWDELFSRTTNKLPFALFDWLTTWWEHFALRERVLRDSLRVYAVRNPAGQLVCILPLMLTERGLPPLTIKTLTFLGADQFITELRCPIVDPAWEEAAAEALAARLVGDGGWDWIEWFGLAPDGAFARALQRALPLDWSTEETTNILHLAPTWEAFKTTRKRNIKESLRRCYNSLKRDGHTLRFESLDDPGSIAEGIDNFLRLHALRASLTDTVPHPDRFEGDVARRFLHDVCGRLARKRVTRVFQLWVDERIVATRIGFVLGDHLYMYFTGYDPAWRDYSVMTTLTAEALRHAIALGLRTVDLSTGSDVSKNRWGPESRVYRAATTVRDRTFSRAALRGFDAARLLARDERLGGVVRRVLPMRGKR